MSLEQPPGPPTGHDVQIVMDDDGGSPSQLGTGIQWVQPNWRAHCRCGWVAKVPRATRSEARRDGRLHLGDAVATAR